MSDIAQENPVSPLFIWFASIAAGVMLPTY